MGDNLWLSEKLYGLLLYLYPKPFRATYKAQMRLTFRDVCRVAYHQNGTRGLMALWLPTLLDLFKSALEAWARQGEITMSKARLIALAGPLTVLVGSVWLVMSIGDLLLMMGLVGDEKVVDLLLALWAFPFLLSFIPMLFALIGTRLRFYPSAGGLGRFGLTLSVAGCVGVIVAVLGSLLLGGATSEGNSSSWVNYAAVVCLLSIRVGYILFGIDAWRYSLLPRWNLLPLLVGSTVLLSLPFEWFGVPALLPLEWVNPFLHFAITGGFWLLLGIAMLNPRREAQRVAMI